MVYKRENGHIIAPQPLARTVDTWQDGATFMTKSCPTICMMRHKIGFMRPDGSVSPLNHPLLVLNASVLLLFLICLKSGQSLHCVISLFHILVGAAGCLVMTFLLEACYE